MIIHVFSNSMIFPCMELFLVIFQVFHDFQSLWEPCDMYVVALLNIYPMYAKYSDTDRPGSKVVNFFLCSTQLNLS